MSLIHTILIVKFEFFLKIGHFKREFDFQRLAVSIDRLKIATVENSKLKIATVEYSRLPTLKIKRHTHNLTFYFQNVF